MSESEEKQPIILTVVNTGTPEFPRYVICNQFLQYFTGSGWTEQRDEKKRWFTETLMTPWKPVVRSCF